MTDQKQGRNSTEYFFNICHLLSVICKNIAEKQARNYQLSFYQEMFRLLTHGILHLCGFDHERSTDEEAMMFSLQEKLLNKIYKVKIEVIYRMTMISSKNKRKKRADILEYIKSETRNGNFPATKEIEKKVGTRIKTHFKGGIRELYDILNIRFPRRAYLPEDFKRISDLINKYKK